MTKKQLIEMRDEKLGRYIGGMREHKRYSVIDDDFNAGFNACMEILLPRIEGLVQGLESASAFAAVTITERDGVYNPEKYPMPDIKRAFQYAIISEEEDGE